ncbi:MAG: hypothetical protein EA397_12560 [Deltaproteobacteria bacterium]|nr:MAG: hypothetical protein EA397_12560 [Deltaproteobacteria bacterium]
MLELDANEAEARLERMTRYRRRLKRLLVSGFLLSILAVLSLGSGALWLLLTPDGLRTLIPYLVNEENSTVTVERVAIHPQSELLNLPSWGLIVYGLSIEPRDRTRTGVSIDQLVLQGPDLPRLWSNRELHVRRAVIGRMHVKARQQRPSPKRERPPNALRLLSADRVELWDGLYTAPFDDPLPAASFTGIYAEVEHMRYDPFDRTLHGLGWLAAQDLTTGDLHFSHILLPKVQAAGSTLNINRGTVRWEAVRARVSGRITAIDSRASVHLKVTLRQARIEKLVRNATGQESPVLGHADIDLDLYSGGNLPRGGGYMDAHVELSDVLIPLPPTTRGIYKDVIRLAPIARLDEEDRVVLKELEGRLSVTRGRVTLHELIYKARPPVLIRGEIDSEDMDLYFRLVLRGDPSTHPGIGLRLFGSPSSPSVARANRDELLPGWREAREAAREEARADGGRGLRRLFRRRGPPGDDEPKDEAEEDL